MSWRGLATVAVMFCMGAVTGAWIAARWSRVEPVPVTVVCMDGERMLPEWAWRRPGR